MGKYQGCFKKVLSSFKEGSRVFEKSVKGVSGKFQGCFTFQKSFKEVSRVFQENFKGILRKFQGYLKEDRRMFQWSFSGFKGI